MKKAFLLFALMLVTSIATAQVIDMKSTDFETEVITTVDHDHNVIKGHMAFNMVECNHTTDLSAYTFNLDLLKTDVSADSELQAVVFYPPECVCNGYGPVVYYCGNHCAWSTSPAVCINWTPQYGCSMMMDICPGYPDDCEGM